VCVSPILPIITTVDNKSAATETQQKKKTTFQQRKLLRRIGFGVGSSGNVLFVLGGFHGGRTIHNSRNKGSIWLADEHRDQGSVWLANEPGDLHGFPLKPPFYQIHLCYGSYRGVSRVGVIGWAAGHAI